MRRYLVGGAVRDQLLGVRRADRDWLVVGTTHEELVGQGYRPVGRQFTSYLHPESAEEYALPRGVAGGRSSDMERDVITDLRRRDLTINAMAMADDGTLVDPFGGREDVRNRQIRHVDGQHFLEDPIRTLRATRLAARLNFQLAPHTRRLIYSAAKDGTLQVLARERIYSELVAGLMCGAPTRFIRELRSSGLLETLLPEVDQLFGIPQPALYHPEIDTGIHILLALEVAHELGANEAVMIAVLLHDLGKGVTAPSEWPRHVRHEHAGIEHVEAVCARLGTPDRVRRLAVVTCSKHLMVHQSPTLRAGTLGKLLEACGVFSQASLLDDVLIACEADARGRAGLEQRPYSAKTWLRKCAAQARTVDVQNLRERGHEGAALGEAIRQDRAALIGKLQRPTAEAE
jgi:tRNA nucleotidyltransferase (CCA-adding enzyme)